MPHKTNDSGQEKVKPANVRVGFVVYTQHGHALTCGILLRQNDGNHIDTGKGVRCAAESGGSRRQMLELKDINRI